MYVYATSESTAKGSNYQYCTVAMSTLGLVILTITENVLSL